jgi:hypothetical protein
MISVVLNVFRRYNDPRSTGGAMSQPTSLELSTTQELIHELMRRTTFLGVVVHSEEEYRTEGWGPERMFRVHLSRNLEASKALRLLDAIVTRLNDREA